jgi:hypothetical protein
MELHLFPGPLTERTTAKQSGKPNANVNPKLPEHHGATGSISRLTACTMRRQFDTSTPICLRPRGLSL